MNKEIEAKGDWTVAAAAKAKLRDQWARDGYRPRAHLASIRADGDPEVLKGFLARERYITPRDPACFLAAHDLYETLMSAAGLVHRDMMEDRAL